MWSISDEARMWFRASLQSWYAEHGRQLPWRSTRDPYKVLVSELMLQQTQVDRVLPKYHAFLGAFPTIYRLAEAPQGEVLRLWAGLGYNSRAVRLHQLAKKVVEDFDGKIPEDIHDLESLPGVGAYTAGAVRTFGHRLPAVFWDVNIKRILHRVFFGLEYPQPLLSDKETSIFAAELAPMDDGSFAYHQALMDVGALYCGATRTDCQACPLASQCKTRVLLASNPLLLAEGRKAQKESRKPKEPFKQSMRFLRGRIIELLRRHHDGLTKSELIAELSALEVPELERIEKALPDLVQEGLVSKKGEVYQL